MSERSIAEVIAFVGLFGAVGYCWIGLVPSAGSPSEYLRNPAYFALVGATLSSISYLGVSLLVTNSLVWRRLLLALFLAGMPLIYLWAAFLASDQQAIVLESVGAAVFIPLALLGYRRSLLVLGVGIAAHGIAWDVWHHHHSAYIEPWYPMGCLVVDLALSFVVAAQHFRGRSALDERTPISTARQSSGN